VQLTDFRRSGHAPSLLAAVIHFTASCAVWTILGALGIYISQSLHLSPGTMGVVVGTPLVAAAFTRVVMGVLADRFGPKRVGAVSMLLAVTPLLWGWLGAYDLVELLGVGLLLGIAGGSFAVSVPLASRWFEAKDQGVAIGIVGAGNAGTVVCTLGAPRLAQAVGWHAALGFAAAPVLAAWVAFMVLAKEPPRPARPLSARSIAAVLREHDTWKLCFFYLVTFGCFVGFTSFLPILLHSQYGLSKLQAATATAVGVGIGSFLRPLGGWAADRIGGTRVLACVYAVAGVILLLVAQAPPLGIILIAFPVAMGLFGIGNGATFQLVGLRFREQIGVVSGLVGAAGGLGGFLLPTLLGTLHNRQGYGLGLGLVAAASIGALGVIVVVRARWNRGWAALAEAQV
jgi:NNP family nitrate/nitrite transporter-like MFS transporter